MALHVHVFNRVKVIQVVDASQHSIRWVLPIDWSFMFYGPLILVLVSTLPPDQRAITEANVYHKNHVLAVLKVLSILIFYNIFLGYSNSIKEDILNWH